VNTLPDADLVEQTRTCGDKQAFGVLLERHQAGALRMAQRLIAHHDTARELVQEAMLEAYLSLASLQKPERFQSWLFGIVINVCRTYLRRRRDDPLSFEALSGGLEATPMLIAGHAPDPQTLVEMRELHDLVLAAIGALSPQNREATLLYYYEQLSLREISAILGISVAAVKGRLHKSRRYLAEYFTTFATHEPWVQPLAPREVAQREVVQKRKSTMIEVQIVDVVVLEEDQQGHHIIILHDEAGQRILPIWVGPFEGSAIAMQLLNDSLVPRPLTYDFMANLVKAAGTVLEEIRIADLQENTYIATAVLRSGESKHEVDARPSDAMALALRLKSKVYVAEEIMAKAGRDIPPKFRGKLPRKGLQEMAAKLENAKREHEEAMAKFRERREEESQSPTDRLFTLIFGES
jgi:RNA polymerase sigma factor (sigma-70 family)